jgi:tetratricopeptide (TPR) repeat protein
MNLAVVATLGFSRVASAQNPQTYVTAVDRYAAGDVSGAIALFANATPRLSGEIVTGMRALPDRQVRAAVVMHTELAAARIRNGEISPATIHIANAQRLLGILTGDARRRTASQTFAVRWYAFVTNVWSGQGRFDAAAASVRDGLTVFPGAAELYVARGCINEARATMVLDLDPRFALIGDRDRVSRDGVRSLEAAVVDFQNALRAEPTLAIANLHRGWIHHRLHDRRAAEELDAALNGATDEGVRYLAHLFLGAAAEVREDLEGARVEFEAAKRLGAHQTSYVALGRVETALGHGERARELAMEFAQLPEKADDPWWDYRLGGFTSGALEWLREEARRP